MAVRYIFLILSLFCASFAFHTPYLVLGPNIEYSASGAAAPIKADGVFVPQLNTAFDFFWVEPLGADGYGVWKQNKTNYIRFLAGAELSPFYGTLRAGLGIAPLPPPFAVLEFRFVYSNENLFWSDVEMPMRPDEVIEPIEPSNGAKKDQIKINKAWNGDYIFDKFYKYSSYAQIQSYDMQLGGKYISRNFDASFLFGFSFIDITSDYDKKSFDYMRGIPLYSRDYVVTEELYASYHFGKSFSWNAEFSAVYSGRQFKFYAPFNVSEKEPLSYSLISTGPLWAFNGSKSHFSVKSGLFTRNGADHAFTDSVKERIIMSIEYRHSWDFRFGKE